MLCIENLACQRGNVRLFSGLEFTVSAGQALHLKGRNGSGKSSLLRVLCGYLGAEAGTVSWNGMALHEDREAYLENLAYIGHLNALKDDLTVAENLRFSLLLCGHTPTEEALESGLDAFGLLARYDLPTRVLSQGQKRRLALCRLRYNAAPLWLLDEPFVALDQAFLHSFQTLLDRHLHDGGVVVYTTHQDVGWRPATERVVTLGEEGQHIC